MDNKKEKKSTKTIETKSKVKRAKGNRKTKAKGKVKLVFKTKRAKRGDKDDKFVFTKVDNNKDMSSFINSFGKRQFNVNKGAKLFLCKLEPGKYIQTNKFQLWNKSKRFIILDSIEITNEGKIIIDGIELAENTNPIFRTKNGHDITILKADVLAF